MLLGFRKQAGLTQEQVAQRLGISQQSYAAFEAHPESASVDRLFRVLRLFSVEMRLSSEALAAPAGPAGQKRAAKSPAQTAATRASAPAAAKPAAPKPRAKPRKREDW
ncbi:helix-turn-helix domain-containing protein [Paraburkholderia sp. A2WS-5]|uniref:helix-turn-helix domain-containing protein n=1 Tax=unclassified Paraburkholderia TaxID=2615204 RepID=UPI003B7C0352